MSDSATRPTSPAVIKLLRAAYEVLTMVYICMAAGRDADALAYTLLANEYIRAARAIEDMEDAARASEESSHV